MKISNLSEYNDERAVIYKKNVAMTVSINIFDVEHSACIELLAKAIMAHSLSELSESIYYLNKFVILKNQHFKNEEGVMLDTRYPDYLEHKTEHRNFSADIEKYINKVQNQETLLENLLSYITMWVNGHIFVYDRRLCQYLNRIGLIKITAVCDL